MIVIFKNEEGTYSVRPAFIGFIKNNIARRVMCSLFYPIVLALTIALNIIQASVVCVFLLVRSVIYPIIKVKPIWKTEIWKRPRTGLDKNSRMD